jgi:hypothetical protein
MATLEGYRFGRLIVDGEEQIRDVIVLPERVITNWWRIEGHRLVLEDLERCPRRPPGAPRHRYRCVRADAS